METWGQRAIQTRLVEMCLPGATAGWEGQKPGAAFVRWYSYGYLRWYPFIHKSWASTEWFDPFHLVMSWKQSPYQPRRISCVMVPTCRFAHSFISCSGNHWHCKCNGVETILRYPSLTFMFHAWLNPQLESWNMKFMKHSSANGISRKARK